MWGDEKFRALSSPQPNGRDCWIHLLTNRETSNIPGLYRAYPETLARDLGWPVKGYLEAFGEALAKGMVKADWNAGLVFVPGAIRRNVPQSPNVIMSWRETWAELPTCSLKLEAYQHFKVYVEGLPQGFRIAFDKALPKGSADPIANQEQEQEQEKDLPPDVAGATFGFDPPPAKTAKAPGKRKTKAKPAPNPLPFTAAQAVDFVAMAAGEHFTDTETPLPKNHVIPIQAHIRSFPDPKRWALAGEYLASGRAFMGEAAPSLLASSKLPELMAKSAAWERHGKPPDAKHPRRVDDNTGPSHAARRDSESVNRNLPTKEQMDADEPEVRRILADFHARNGTQ